MKDGPFITIKEGDFQVSYLNRSNFSGEVSSNLYNSLPATLLCFVEEDNIEQLNFEIEFTDADPVIPLEIYEMPEKVLCISDIEGNFYAFEKILKSAGVINDEYNWSYGKNHLVLLGDLIDRSNNVMQCLWLAYKLEQQAARMGGVVHVLIGNHEVMNFTGDFRYVHSKYLSNKLYFTLYRTTFSPDSFLGKWLLTKNTVEKIGNYLFVHAGISTEVLLSQHSISTINNAIRNGLFSDTAVKDPLLFGPSGPFWYRGLVRNIQTGIDIKADMQKICQYFDVAAMVVGHTIVPVIQEFAGLIAIDVQQPQKAGDGWPKALLVHNEKEYIISAVDGNPTLEIL